jgi:hypothetical protein
MELLRTTGFFNCLSQTIQTNNQYLLHVAEKGKVTANTNWKWKTFKDTSREVTSSLWYHSLWTWQVPQVQVLKLWDYIGLQMRKIIGLSVEFKQFTACQERWWLRRPCHSASSQCTSSISPAETRMDMIQSRTPLHWCMPVEFLDPHHDIYAWRACKKLPKHSSIHPYSIYKQPD